MRNVEIEPAFQAWQQAARILLREQVPPAEVVWRETAIAPLGAAPVDREKPASSASPPPDTVRVPRRFIELARAVAIHCEPSRWSLLYGVLWRLVHERRDLLETADFEVARLFELEAQVRAGRDIVTAAPFVPAGASVEMLRMAAARCEGCDLYRHASQTVFGAGPADARIALVGEQPGDQEDQRGAPFVGPAGEVLDRALVEVGLRRELIYVSNVVKHFKFIQRGKRRIHQTPGQADISACRPWIEAELKLVRPDILVCLGATAARALLEPGFRLLKERGRFFETRWTPRTIATLHPSAVLRGEDEPAQARLYAMLRDDLRLVAEATVSLPKFP